MRVLHTIHSLAPSTGGTARSVSQLALAQAAAGAEVFVWCAADPDCASRTEQRGLSVLQHPQIKDALQASRADVVHDHGVWLACNHRVAQASRQLGVPRVVSPRGMLEPWSMRHRRWKKRVAWWAYQRRDLLRAAGVHATADSESGHLRRLGVTAPIVVAPNGVAAPAKSLEKKPLASGDRTAIFVGRLHPKKGLPMLIEAWAQVRPAGWRMLVVGPDEQRHRGELTELAQRNGVQDCWDFCGEANGDEKWRLLADSDLLVLPTHSENFGNVVAEALFASVPVLTTTGAPWAGLVEHDCGWWVDPTPSGIADGLRAATSATPEDLAARGQRGAQWARAEFRWESVATRLLEFYETLLRSARTRSTED